MTTEFLRFAEKYFTKGKADPQHSPSIRSCLVRVPSTFNSKNNEEVKIIQRWNGDRPPIQCITREFQAYLIQKRIDKLKERKKLSESKRRYSSFSPSGRLEIDWIERLLETPIEDNRKYCLWRILCPYIINVKKVKPYEAEDILKEWLDKCRTVENLTFNPAVYIKNDLRHVGSYRPPKLETLKREKPNIVQLLKAKNILI